MPGFFAPFSSTKEDGVNVLTIAGAFPTLIQPWLVNHLVEIINHGGDNRIISRREELDKVAEMVKKHHLTEKYCCIPEDKLALIKHYVGAMCDKRIRKNTADLMSRYQRQNHSIKQRLFDRLAAPAFSVQPDIIHSHSEPAGAKFLPLIRAMNAPFVQTFHGLTPVGVPTISADTRRAYSRVAKAIFVNTDFARKQYEAIGGESDNFIVIPQGIDLNRWQFYPNQYPEDGVIHMLTVGRLDDEKGHTYVIEAVAALLNKGFKVQYHIVGRGPKRESLQEKAVTLGVSDNIQFHGVLVDKALTDIYRRCHIFILPSLRSGDGLWEETQGVVLQEAQATGLHVIACDSGGIRECLDGGRVGHLIPDKDSKAIVEAVKEIIHCREEWFQYQQVARQWVEDNYSLTAIGQRMNEIYRHVISEADEKR